MSVWQVIFYLASIQFLVRFGLHIGLCTSGPTPTWHTFLWFTQVIHFNPHQNHYKWNRPDNGSLVCANTHVMNIVNELLKYEGKKCYLRLMGRVWTISLAYSLLMNCLLPWHLYMQGTSSPSPPPSMNILTIYFGNTTNNHVILLFHYNSIPVIEFLFSWFRVSSSLTPFRTLKRVTAFSQSNGPLRGTPFILFCLNHKYRA